MEESITGNVFSSFGNLRCSSLCIPVACKREARHFHANPIRIRFPYRTGCSEQLAAWTDVFIGCICFLRFRAMSR